MIKIPFASKALLFTDILTSLLKKRYTSVFLKFVLLIAIFTTLLFITDPNTVTYKMRPAIALFSGVFLSIFFSSPYENIAKKLTSTLLACSIVGLGFGINLMTILKAGLSTIIETLLSIFLCLICGIILKKILGTKRDTSLLITFGTAICGGSAIATLAPIIRAKHDETSVALAVVFILNGLALLLFPTIGHYFKFTETQFGLWAALSIHDTSSVLGATVAYGSQSLAIGTTVKLARALWIIPIALIIRIFYCQHQSIHPEKTPITQAKKPWFILGFLVASAIVTWFPTLRALGLLLHKLAEQTFILTLFFIGSRLSFKALKTVGIKPFVHGSLLWFVMASATLFFCYIKK